MGGDTLEEKIASDPDIICGEDGFYVYWPTSNKGAYSPFHLRLIADVLDEKNKDWSEQLEFFMKNNP